VLVRNSEAQLLPIRSETQWPWTASVSSGLVRWSRSYLLSSPLEKSAAATDLISPLKKLLDCSLRRGICYPQWWMLLVIPAILSNQGSLHAIERFAKRHRKILNELLGIHIAISLSDSTIMLFLVVTRGLIQPAIYALLPRHRGQPLHSAQFKQQRRHWVPCMFPSCLFTAALCSRSGNSLGSRRWARRFKPPCSTAS